MHHAALCGSSGVAMGTAPHVVVAARQRNEGLARCGGVVAAQYYLQGKELAMNESTISAKGKTTVPANIRQTIGGVPGTRLLWHVLADGRLFVRVKNKTAADVKGSVKVPQGKRLSVEDTRPYC